MTNYAVKTTNYVKVIRKGGFFVILKMEKYFEFGKGGVPLSLGLHPKETSLLE